jgi:hypothetical protein
MNMTKILSTAALTAAMGLAFVPQAYAQAEVCFCHNANTQPQTECSTNAGVINAHTVHVTNGLDTAGACPAEPTVPEFGLITGLVTLASSAGGYYLLKRKSA